MAEQNFKNHVRYVPFYHFVTFGAILLMLAGAVVNLMRASGNTVLPAVLLLLASLILFSLFFFARVFALRAHDKAIRAEEKLRFYLVTGKRMDEKLRMGQIIAMRFAPDEELEELARRAVEEQLSGTDIKKAIRNWKTDYYRV